MALSNAERQRRHREKRKEKERGVDICELFDLLRMDVVDQMIEQKREAGEEYSQDEIDVLAHIRDMQVDSDEVEQYVTRAIRSAIYRTAMSKLKPVVEE